MNWKNRLPFFIPLLFTLVYLLFPTTNSTIDAYTYAAEVQQGHELFNPHHLLYNWLGFYFCKPILHIFPATSILSALKALNALFAGSCLLLLSSILNTLSNKKLRNAALVSFVGASFGVFRFATENETYMIPVFFSLLGSLFFAHCLRKNTDNQNFYKKKRSITFPYGHKKWVAYYLAASFFAALACLFHQVQFFWWFGLLISSLYIFRSFRALVIFSLPAFLVPVVYFAVFQEEPHTISLTGFIHFVFEKFYDGSVETNISTTHFLLTAINLVRTFLQIHGNSILVLKKNLLLLPVSLIAIGLMISGVVQVRLKLLPPAQPFIFYSHLFIFLLQLIFTWYSVGNAEFMVMLPFLAAILLACLQTPTSKAVWLVSAGIFVWNLSLAILPAHFYDLNGNGAIRKFISNNPNTLFIIKNKPQVNAEFIYYSGKFPSHVLPDPYYFILKGKSPDSLKAILLAEINEGKTVLTNAVGNTEVMNRSSFLSNGENKQFFKSFRLTASDTLHGYLTDPIFYRVSK